MNDVNFQNDAGRVASLQNQIFFLKLVLIVFSGTLVAYLCYQSHVAGKEVAAIRPQAQPVIQAFKENYQKAEDFKAQLGKYALTHPDFQPILRKYGWTPAATTNPAPAKKAPVKK